MLTRNNLLEINKQFDNGKIINESSLDFALDCVKSSKDWKTQVAYLVRAIVLDHVFEEGNKRTGAAIITGYCRVYNIRYDQYKLDKIIVEIIKKNINSIEKIRRMIENATYK